MTTVLNITEFFEKSIVFFQFEDKDAFGVDGIYVTTTSNIEILDNTIVSLDSSVKINNLEDSDNEKVIEELNEYMEIVESIVTSGVSNYSINKIMNYYINSNINLFCSALKIKTLEFCDNGLKFVSQ